MSFFDDKQEVISMELTPYGRFLLSKGKFKPVYYSFFDDDIVYDGRYISITESQNSIQERILNETLVNKPQTTHYSLENNYSNLNIHKIDSTILEKIDQIQNQSDKNYSTIFSLGNCDYNSEYAPSWQINFLNSSARILSCLPYIDNSTGLATNNANETYILQPFLNIPQININNQVISIKTFEGMPEKDYVTVFEVESERNVFETIPIYQKNDYLLIDIQEDNTQFLNDNFEIEVFVEEQVNNTKYWKSLEFIRNKIEIKNNILLDEPETFLNIKEINTSFDDSLVNHYFELLIDDEIELPPEIKKEFRELYKPTDAKGALGNDCPPGVDC